MAKVAIGLKAHSGWAALVAVGGSAKAPEVIERRRVELVQGTDSGWKKHPYHAAEELDPAAGERLVERGIESARKLGEREVRKAAEQLRGSGHEVVGCSVLLGSGMPEWSVAQILAVHARMHHAEGELFRDVLVRGAERCGLRSIAVRERELWERGAKQLRIPAALLRKRIDELGKTVGPPWGKDQKEAGLLAWMTLASTKAN